MIVFLFMMLLMLLYPTFCTAQSAAQLPIHKLVFHRHQAASPLKIDSQHNDQQLFLETWKSTGTFGKSSINRSF